jgi:hypothetical protein
LGSNAGLRAAEPHCSVYGASFSSSSNPAGYSGQVSGVGQIDPLCRPVPPRLQDRHAAFLVHAPVHERRVEHEDDLVMRPPAELETVLEHAEPDRLVDLESQLLLDLAAQRVGRRLAEFDRPA